MSQVASEVSFGEAGCSWPHPGEPVMCSLLPPEASGQKTLTGPQRTHSILEKDERHKGEISAFQKVFFGLTRGKTSRMKTNWLVLTPPVKVDAQ